MISELTYDNQAEAHQWTSVDISGHQWSSVVIRGH
jgi:hypothetical protein